MYVFTCFPRSILCTRTALGPVMVHSHNSGADAKALLQGLITNDMSLLDEGAGRQPCISAAFLNPKVRLS